MIRHLRSLGALLALLALALVPAVSLAQTYSQPSGTGRVGPRVPCIDINGVSTFCIATGVQTLDTAGTAYTAGGTQTTSGAVQPATAASGKIAQGSSAISAASTTIVAANANRIGIEIQCSVACKISPTGATLTSATQTVGEGGIAIVTAGGLYHPDIPSLTAYTVYGSGAGVVTYTDYNR